MRRLIPAAALMALCAAAPASALTVSSAPNRDQAAHLKTGTGPGGGVDLRDTLAGGGRPLTGGDSYSAGTFRQTQTFGFGAVTTTVTTGPAQDLRPSFQVPGRPVALEPGRAGRPR